MPTSRSRSRSTASFEKPALYEYRPLVKPFIEQRAHTLRQRPDAQLAVEELLRQPAATIFARAHAGPRAREDEALFGSVLLPLLVDDGGSRAAASTGTTTRSRARMPSSSGRCSATDTSTARSRP